MKKITLLILKLSVRNGPSVSFGTNIPCSLPFIITFRIRHMTRFRSFKNNEPLKPVLRIHLILMRIRILDPHWEKMDPDPGHGHFFKVLFEVRKLLIFSLFSSDLGKSKKFLLQFFVDILAHGSVIRIFLLIQV